MGIMVLNISLAGLFLKMAYNSKVTDFEEEERLGYLFSTLLTASLSKSKIEIFLDGNIGIEFLEIKWSLVTTIVLLFIANRIITKKNGMEYRVKKLKIIAIKIKMNKKMFF
mgnify:CR=1 FL=1